jgi:hypothetical protein
MDDAEPAARPAAGKPIGPGKAPPSWGQIAALFFASVILGPSLCAATFASKLDSDTQVVVAVIIGIAGLAVFVTSIVFMVKRAIHRLRGRS